MPRFVVTLCDTNSAEIHTVIRKNSDDVSALLSHPWITEMYLPKYIENNLADVTYENTAQKIYETLSWAACVVNLDQEIMNDLNGGDSSVSSPTQLP